MPVTRDTILRKAKSEVLESLPVMIALHDPENNIVWANRSFREVTGTSLKEIEGKKCHSAWGLDRLCNDCPVVRAIETGTSTESELTQGNQGHWLESHGAWLCKASPIWDDDGSIIGAIEISFDISERKRVSEALRESEKRYKAVSELTSDYAYAFRVEPGGEIVSEWVTDGLGRLSGYSHEELLAAGGWEKMIHPEDLKIALGQLESLLADRPSTVEYRIIARGGIVRWMRDYARPIWDKDAKRVTRIEGAVQDITEQKVAEDERETLQIQLSQAGKIESIGRLAGGVAHDFNNMLSVIQGNVELILAGMSSEDPLRADLEQVRKAAARSADLTRQLLAFARKQVITPEILDLNETVGGMLGMLRRLIGENIDLLWSPGVDLWPIRFDPSQVDMVLANLCINARDAIDGVGRLTIETANIELDDTWCASRPEITSGQYVMLAVSDDGMGMDDEVLEKIFEPFFTTKEVGKGTGLGLATVYGVVRQNEGFIDVYTEPGDGSIFKIYLPRFIGDVEGSVAKAGEDSSAGRGEKIIVVEDERMVLDVTRSMLEGLGYVVLTAASPGEALEKIKDHEKDLQLVITDVVMPEMNGPDLAREIARINSGIKCIYTSGYTANVIEHRSLLEEGMHFLQKPFSLRLLGDKVREVLDQEKEIPQI